MIVLRRPEWPSTERLGVWWANCLGSRADNLTPFRSRPLKLRSGRNLSWAYVWACRQKRRHSGREVRLGRALQPALVHRHLRRRNCVTSVGFN